MTLKYKLIIEGTEKELEFPKNLGLHNHAIQFDHVLSYCLEESFVYRGVITQVEYKVVEPLRMEYDATINEHGVINLVVPRHSLLAHTGKKVKVVITEEVE